MKLAREVMSFQIQPRPSPAVRTTHVEWTNRPRATHRLHLEKDGDFVTVPNELRHRFETLCRLNRPAALVVLSMTNRTFRLDALTHHAFRGELEGMLSLAVHMGDKPIADISSPASLSRDSIRTFLDGLPPSEEIAYVVLDKNHLHRGGRMELFWTGLHLYCNRKEAP